MPRLNEAEKPVELPQLTRPNQPSPTTEARTSTKQALTESSDSLTKQVQALVDKMDTSDRTLARQLAGYVADRPSRFTQMLAGELRTALAPQEETFVDVEVLPESKVQFGGWNTIAPHPCAGALMP